MAIWDVSEVVEKLIANVDSIGNQDTSNEESASTKVASVPFTSETAETLRKAAQELREVNTNKITIDDLRAYVKEASNGKDR